MPTTQALALTCLRHGSAPRSGRASSQSGRAPCPSGSLKKTHINPKKMRYRRQFEEHTGPRKRTFTPANLEHVRPGGHKPGKRHQHRRRACVLGDPVTAERYTAAIADYCQSLSTFPERAPARDDIRPGLRISHYRGRTIIAYQLDATTDRVIIHGIYYGGQNFEADLIGG